MVYRRCPKRVYSNRTTLEIAVASAVISFNEGEQGLSSVFEKLHIPVGHYYSKGLHNIDITRMHHMNRKSIDSRKHKGNISVQRGKGTLVSMRTKKEQPIAVVNYRRFILLCLILLFYYYTLRNLCDFSEPMFFKV